MERDRIRAVTEFTRDIAVDASAGTGKTATLIARVTNLFLAKKDLHPDNVLLLTFTDKAAAEMKSRVAEGWETLLAACRDCDGIPGVEDRIRGWNSLVRVPDGVYASLDELAARAEEMADGVGRLSATTFHSFCRRVLLSFPAEAGVDPKFDVLPESAASDAWDAAFSLFLRAEFAGDRPDPRWDRLLSRAASHDAVWGMIRRLCVSQRDLLAEAALDFGSPADFLAHLRREYAGPVRWFGDFVQGIAARGHEMVPVFERALSVLAAGWEAIGKGDLERAGDLAADGAGAFDFPANKVRAGKSFPFPAGGTLAGSRDALKTMWKELSEVPAGDAAARFLVDRARAAVAFYRHAKGSGLDFMDLLLRANDLLCGNSVVARRLSERFRYILVDEFQDTDPLQAEMLRALSADGRPGRLFLVGDPKQSIYGFRRADIQVYNRFRNDLISASGEGIALVRNFRSRPDLLGAVNALFGRILSGREDFSPPYAPVEPYRSDAGAGSAVTFFSLDEAVAEPDFLCALVERIVGTVAVGGSAGAPERPASYRDIAVLYRSDTGGEVLASYRKALARAGIPHVVPPRKGFYARQEIQDLRMVLSAVDVPADPSARYAALKTIFFGLRDEEILPVFGVGGAPSPRARDALAVLDALAARRGRVSLSDLVAALYRETGVDFVAGRLPEGERIVANLGKAFAMARVFEWEGGGTVKAFLAELRRKTSEDRLESEFPSFDEGENAVRISTIHSSKGLEFPVVILANLSRGARKAPEGLRVDRVRKVGAVLFPGIRTYSAFREVRLAGRAIPFEQWEREKQDAEERRLLYVAATRARDRLFLVDAGKGRGKGAELLSALREGLEGAPDSGDAACAVTGLAGRVRRFPSGADILHVHVREPLSMGLSPRPPLPGPPAFDRPMPPASPGSEPPAPVPLREFHDRAVGRLFGEKVHRALEACPPVLAPWPPPGFVPPVAWGEGEEARWRRICARIAASPIHRDLCGNSGAWTEVPMLRFTAGRAIEERADLVVRVRRSGTGGDEYVVVDYKTGEREAGAEAQYLAGLRDYMEILAGAWGVGVRGLLWYVETGEAVEAIGRDG